MAHLPPGKKRMDFLRMFDSAEDVEEYPAGTAIFSVGDPGDCMFVILDGEVELRKDGTVLNTLGPGSLLGVVALISEDRRRSATAVARSDCRLAPVSQRRFLFLIQQTPFFALEVMRALAEQLLRKE
jgi:CRP/FNR family transcriptional regulator, cyclic AMP receptor protein